MPGLKSGFRQIIRKPLFSALAILLLSVGIGANVLIFTFVDTLLLRPLPVRNPQNLWMLQALYSEMIYPEVSFSYRQFEELQKRSDLFTAVTAEEAWSEIWAYPLTETGSARLVTTQILAPNYFDELGIKPFLGRVFTPEDGKPSTNVPALLSYQFWQSHYGGRRDVLGQTLRLKNFPFTIVGVLPRDFHSVDIERAPDVRLPISAGPFLEGKQVDDPRGDQSFGFCVLARLKPGVSAAAAQQVIREPLHRFSEREVMERYADYKGPRKSEIIARDEQFIAEERFAFEPVGTGMSGLRTQFSQALKILMAGVIVLLIAVCANVAGLLIGRGEERRKELAVRMSIGASRWRLLRQLTIENLCLAVPGSLLGLFLGYILAPMLLRILPPVRSLDQFASPPILTVSIDSRVLLFTWLLLVASLCLFGLIPAWRATRLDINGELKGTTRPKSHSLAALMPVAVQVMISVLLLASGALMLRNYWSLEALNPGFDRAHVFSFTLGLDRAGFTDAQANAYQRELESKALQLPGVRSVAFSTLGLMRGSGFKTTVTIPGAVKSERLFMNTSLAAVTPSYFDALGIPLLAGRKLYSTDVNAKLQPVVINRALADSLFPNQNPIGQGIVPGNDGSKSATMTVVGLAETAKFRRLQEPSPPIFYSLLPNAKQGRLVMFIRTEGEPARVMKAAEQVVRKAGGGVPIIEEQLLEQEVQATIWQEKLVARLAAFFSLIALLLAALGLYGTLAFSVVRRRRELGIRIAIGADFQQIVKTVCGRMSLAVGVGLLAGLFAAAVALRFTKHFLYAVEPLDAPSFIGAAVLALACVCLAAVIPCRRAVRTDAATALRAD